MTLDLARLSDTTQALISAIQEDFGDSDAFIGDLVIVVEIVSPASGGRSRSRQIRIRAPEDVRHHALRGLLDEASGTLVFQRHQPRRSGESRD